MAGKFQKDAYLNTQIKTASRERLLMMLFDGALKFANICKQAILNRDIATCSENSIKVQNIMTELMSSLDSDVVSEELYQNLMGLYAFVHKRMVSANLERKPEYVDEAIEILNRLRGIWNGAIDKALEENDGKLPEIPPPGVKPNIPAKSGNQQAPAPQQASALSSNAMASMQQAGKVARSNRRGASAATNAYQASGSKNAPPPEEEATEDPKFPMPAGSGPQASSEEPPKKGPPKKPPLSKLPGQAGPLKKAVPMKKKAPPRPGGAPPGPPPAGGPPGMRKKKKKKVLRRPNQ